MVHDADAPRSCVDYSGQTFLGYGCVVLVALGIAIMLLADFAMKEAERTSMAEALEYDAGKMLMAMEIPESERVAAMVPVADFAQRVKKGEVSLVQAAGVLSAFFRGPVFMVIATRVFEVKCLRKSVLSDAEKKAGRIALSRFTHGVVEGRIPWEKEAEIDKFVAIRESGNRVEFKESLTPEELKKCLMIAKDAADAAGIADKEHAIDLPGEIRKEIDKGMQAAPPPPANP